MFLLTRWNIAPHEIQNLTSNYFFLRIWIRHFIHQIRGRIPLARRRHLAMFKSKRKSSSISKDDREIYRFSTTGSGVVSRRRGDEVRLWLLHGKCNWRWLKRRRRRAPPGGYNQLDSPRLWRELHPSQLSHIRNSLHRHLSFHVPSTSAWL